MKEIKKDFSEELKTVALRVQLYHWISVYYASLKKSINFRSMVPSVLHFSIHGLLSLEGAINDT